ncbi:energy transducer TonB [Methyloradius palustris]|uniref:Transporter TonB n=1 Tax=Methyloradius palustris TaxID=2778876 RepID=A0A8D5GAQ6_9PROT|nr:energy transducer TonB [Methyloradius palustris]BCM26121.1 transporter TonB [Methyloradius palustris]
MNPRIALTKWSLKLKRYTQYMGPLGIMLLVSFLLHAGLIVSLKFELPSPKFFQDKMPALDIVLVNAKTKSKPTKADLLAQANLNRGGNTDDNRHLKSALPPPKDQQLDTSIKPATEAKQAAKKLADTANQAELTQQRVAELEKQAQELMTQINAKNKVETNPTQKAAAAQTQKGQQDNTAKKLDAADLMASSLDIARFEAQIAKEQDEYQKRPKRKYIGARTQEYRFATYVEAWRQKVEKIGNLNYPEAAKTQKLYGQLRMTVSIKSDGSIESISIDQSSGSKVLDDAAKNIVTMAAPYAAFPDDIRKDTDILGITRTWTFTKQDSLATEQ